LPQVDAVHWQGAAWRPMISVPQDDCAGDLMKYLLPLSLAAMLLAGCPDTRSPKLPPQVPEPKAALAPSTTPIAMVLAPRPATA